MRRMHCISKHHRFIGRQLVQQCFIAPDESCRLRLVQLARDRLPKPLADQIGQELKRRQGFRLFQPIDATAGLPQPWQKLERALLRLMRAKTKAIDMPRWVGELLCLGASPATRWLVVSRGLRRLLSNACALSHTRTTGIRKIFTAMEIPVARRGPGDYLTSHCRGWRFPRISRHYPQG